MTETLKKILLVEDNSEIVQLIHEYRPQFENRFSIEVVADGTVGLERALSRDFDLLLLDIMLPGLSGIDICKQVRREDEEIPILLISAKSSEMDRVLGLELGADDYLVKPFSVAELFSRIDALLRRRAFTQLNESGENTLLQFKELQIDIPKRIVTASGQQIDLTPTEFALLHFLATRSGIAFSRFDILNAIWGDESSGAEEMINAHINRLRRKLSNNRQRYIKTVWGVGYRFVTKDECE